jgi:hypothetical protein
MSRLANFGVVALVAVGLLAGCSSTSPSPIPTPLGVCGLVPNMDELVGKTAVDQPGGFTLNDVDTCIWTYALNPSRSVDLSVAAVVAHQAAIDELGDGEQVASLADDARWWAGNRLLSVALDDRAVQVSLKLDDVDSTRDLAVRIAQAAVANLT